MGASQILEIGINLGGTQNTPLPPLSPNFWNAPRVIFAIYINYEMWYYLTLYM